MRSKIGTLLFLILIGSLSVGCRGQVSTETDAGSDALYEDAGQDGGSDPGSDSGPDEGLDGAGDDQADSGQDAGPDAGQDGAGDGDANQGADTAEDRLSQQVQSAMLRAMAFMRSIAIHGGYAGIYSLDLQEKYGEGFYETVEPGYIWIQPPGTPSVGEAYLRAYNITGVAVYLEAARDVGRAVAWAQRLEGGWDHQGDVSGLEPTTVSFERVSGQCTFDDDISQGGLRFLMNLDNVISEDWLTESIALGIGFFLDSQFANGAWPQWYPLRGSYHDYYTFNDNTINDCIAMLIQIHKRYGEAVYLDRVNL
ncbi:MAG: hypothetical protein JRJ87_26500, partial [Deltaproteobacteria bacterium]|nr:hypothetical protein [Deltaproteobacteria bacterium]